MDVNGGSSSGSKSGCVEPPVPTAKYKALLSAILAPIGFCLAAFLFAFGVPLFGAMSAAVLSWLGLLVWVARSRDSNNNRLSLPAAIGWVLIAASGMATTVGTLWLISSCVPR